MRDGEDLGRGVLIVHVERLGILVNLLRVNSRADGCIERLSTGNLIDSISPPLRIGVITTSPLNNSTHLFSANEFIGLLLQDMASSLFVTP